MRGAHEEYTGEIGDVLAAVAQRRQPDLDGVQPVQEIIAQLALQGGAQLELCAQRREQARVVPWLLDVVARAAPDRFDRAFDRAPRGPRLIGEARAARDAAGLLLNGRPNRSSAAYVGIVRDGEVAVGRSGPGIHAEVAADAQLPGGTMTEVMGWRRNRVTDQLEWRQIPICTNCQTLFPPERFVPGTLRDP